LAYGFGGDARIRALAPFHFFVRVPVGSSPPTMGMGNGWFPLFSWNAMLVCTRRPSRFRGGLLGAIVSLLPLYRLIGKRRAPHPPTVFHVT